jgi:hypothetical protein
MASARIALASSLRLGIGSSKGKAETERDRAGRRVARGAIVADGGAVVVPRMSCRGKRLNNF